MNVYLIVIVTALFLEFLLGSTSRHFNDRALSPDLPEEFRDVYDRERYRKSQEYAKVAGRLEQLEETIDTAILIPFIIFGGFAWLDSAARAFGFGPILTGLAFYALAGLGHEILSTPFSLYRTFRLEERFGFNKTTPKLYVLDKIKSYILTATIGAPILAAVIYFYETLGDAAWLVAWGFTVLVMLGVQYVAPTWILPLFNRFTPLPEGNLREALEKLAKEQGFRLSGIFVMDGSKRSARANAFFTGFGRKKRIALFDTLIDELSVEEITAVLAHEIGHCKHGHIKRLMGLGVLKTGLIFFLMSLFMESRGLFEAFGLEQTSVYAGLMFFLILYSPVSMLLSILTGVLSRKYEYEADAFAKAASGSPAPLVKALKHLSVSNLANLTPHPLHVFLNYSHPPVLARIRALESRA